jgi:hypothetical protein
MAFPPWLSIRIALWVASGCTVAAAWFIVSRSCVDGPSESGDFPQSLPAGAMQGIDEIADVICKNLRRVVIEALLGLGC